MDSVISWMVLFIVAIIGGIKFAIIALDDMDRAQREGVEWWEREERRGR